MTGRLDAPAIGLAIGKHAGTSHGILMSSLRSGSGLLSLSLGMRRQLECFKRNVAITPRIRGRCGYMIDRFLTYHSLESSIS